MAAKTAIPSKEQQDRTRAAIKTSQLINRLQNFALAENSDDSLILDKDRLKAIEVLLKKSLPDLSSIQLDANVNGELNVVFQTVYEDKPKK